MKTQEDKIDILFDIIRNNHRENGVRVELIKDKAKMRNVSPEFVKEFIKRSKREGQLYSPKDGFVKIPNLTK